MIVQFVFHFFQFSLNKQPSTVSLHILRCTGAFAIGEAVTTLQAPGFLHPRDKQGLFLTRIVVSVEFMYFSCMNNSLFLFVIGFILHMLTRIAF
jgi:hypothetical protein